MYYLPRRGFENVCTRCQALGNSDFLSITRWTSQDAFVLHRFLLSSSPRDGFHMRTRRYKPFMKTCFSLNCAIGYMSWGSCLLLSSPLYIPIVSAAGRYFLYVLSRRSFFFSERTPGMLFALRILLRYPSLTHTQDADLGDVHTTWTFLPRLSVVLGRCSRPRTIYENNRPSSSRLSTKNW